MERGHSYDMQQRLRVAIDGAQATGKSTLLNDLKGRLPETVALIPEASRVLAPRFRIRSAVDWPALLQDAKRLEQFFSAEEDWQRQQQQWPRFVIDSSLLLTAAYRAIFGRRDESRCQFEYDLIFFCPLAAMPWVDDGFRFDQNRAEIEREYLRLLRLYHVGAVVVLDALADRVAIVTSRIDQALTSGSP